MNEHLPYSVVKYLATLLNVLVVFIGVPDKLVLGMNSWPSIFYCISRKISVDRNAVGYVNL